MVSAVVMFLMCLLFTGYKVAYFFWVPLLPILFAVWVMRARTEVGPEGITAVYLFKGKVTVPWDELRGIRFNRGGRAFAARGSGQAPKSFREDRAQNVYLPGVTFQLLPALSEASGGRIPDPIAASAEATKDSVTTVNRDGYAVMKTAEEAATEANAKAVAEEIRRRQEAGTYPATPESDA